MTQERAPEGAIELVLKTHLIKCNQRHQSDGDEKVGWCDLNPPGVNVLLRPKWRQIIAVPLSSSQLVLVQPIADLNASTKTVRQVLAFQLRGIMILYRSVDEGFQVVDGIIKWNNQIYNVSILIILQIFHIYVCHTI